jgi:hypothetical protein
MNKCTWQSLTFESIYFWVFLIFLVASFRDACVNNPSTARANREKWHQAIEKCVEEKMMQNENFVCPLTGRIMKDPVLAEDGVTYEAAAINRWLSENHSSPMTNLTMPEHVIPNNFARTEIQKARNKLKESCVRFCTCDSGLPSIACAVKKEEEEEEEEECSPPTMSTLLSASSRPDFCASNTPKFFAPCSRPSPFPDYRSWAPFPLSLSHVFNTGG